MNEDDIFYFQNNHVFNFRVALLPLYEDKILLQKPIVDDYFSLLGGRVKLGETTSEAILREAKEELGLNLSANDLSLNVIAENFFAYGDKDAHELLFVYRWPIPQDHILLQKDNFSSVDKEDIIISWHRLKELSDIDLRPEFIKQCLPNSALQYLQYKDLSA